MKDIARICKVSEGTVDRALNNRSGIKEETKQKILKVAEELNYQPNQLARCLVKGQTKTIGVVCINLKNPFFSFLIEEIEAYAKKNGYFIHLILSHNDVNKELEGIQYLTSRRVDGLIIFPVGCGTAYEQELKKMKVPIVTIYNRISKEFIHVDVDCRQIMRNAVSYIAGKGYSKIVYLDYGTLRLEKQGVNMFSMLQRRQGYLDGIKDEMLKESVIFEECDKEKLIGLAKSNRSEKTAVLCPCDNTAIHALNILKSHGIQVPEQIGIMGFDNIEMLNLITPRIASVDCEVKILGRKAVSILMRLIDKDQTVNDCVVGYTLVGGESL